MSVFSFQFMPLILTWQTRFVAIREREREEKRERTVRVSFKTAARETTQAERVLVNLQFKFKIPSLIKFAMR